MRKTFLKLSDKCVGFLGTELGAVGDDMGFVFKSSEGVLCNIYQYIYMRPLGSGGADIKISSPVSDDTSLHI